MTTTSSTRLLIIFLKEPIPGTVKTRLAAAVGAEEAAQIYKALVAVLLRQLQGIKDCDLWFVYTPDDASEATAFWILPQLGPVQRSEGETFFLSQSGSPCPTRLSFHPQGGGDLGARLSRIFRAAFAQGYQKVGVVGSDCPYVSNRWVETSFTQCQANKAVLGPAKDGGYYLLVLSQMVEEVFEEIPWSTSETLSTSLAQLTRAGYEAVLLPELSDIDELCDWEEALNSPLGPALRRAYRKESSKEWKN